MRGGAIPSIERGGQKNRTAKGGKLYHYAGALAEGGKRGGKEN